MFLLKPYNQVPYKYTQECYLDNDKIIKYCIYHQIQHTKKTKSLNDIGKNKLKIII